MATLTSFDLFCDKIRYLQPSVLVAKDYKPALLGVFPKNVLSTVVRSRCKQRVVFSVFKALCGVSVCRYFFPLLPFHGVFQASVDDV